MLTRLAGMAFAALPLVLSSLGFAATGHPACPPGQHWVNAHHRRAYIRANGTPVSASHVQAHCQTNPPSYAVWSDRLKAGMPPRWEHKGEKLKPWTEEERERVLEALADLPDLLLGLPVQGIYRLSKSDPDSENPGAGHGSDIALYDAAFSSDQNLSRVLAHELAHVLYDRFTQLDARAYNVAARWKVTRTPNRNQVFIPRMDGFVEEDGAEGPNEDFSNNIEYFLFNSKILLEKTPKVYDWIRKRYGEKFKLKGSGK
jgi:hypothetical protein